ncbi:MAG: MAPEG family protein [Myxococcales bacterium]|jgi:uncharacterized MAPEG superfamily protein
MTIPLYVLLAFALWTLFVLGATIGTYRWGHILTGRARFEDYGRYRIEGTGWYARAMRAHANCLENLPIYGAIVLVGVALGAGSPALDVLALILIVARVAQTFVHVAFEQTNVVVAFRSTFYNTQFICMIAMGIMVAIQVAR